MLRNLDLWIIARVEKFCHSFQQWTGKTNFFLEGVANLLLAAMLIAPVLRLTFAQPLYNFEQIVLKFAKEKTVWYLILIAVLLRTGLWQWKEDESKAFERIGQRLANPKKEHLLWRTVRLVFVFMTVLNIVLNLSLGVIFGQDLLFIALGALIPILSACDPLPPCRGKIQEWLATAFLKPALQQSTGSRGSS